MGKGREAVDPDKIPWDALRTIVSESVFGGKIDNDFDHKILQSLVNYLSEKRLLTRSTHYSSLWRLNLLQFQITRLTKTLSNGLKICQQQNLQLGLGCLLMLKS